VTLKNGSNVVTQSIKQSRAAEDEIRRVRPKSYMKTSGGFCRSRTAESFNLDAMIVEMAKTMEHAEPASKGPTQEKKKENAR